MEETGCQNEDSRAFGWGPAIDVTGKESITESGYLKAKIWKQVINLTQFAQDFPGFKTKCSITPESFSPR